MFLPTRSSCYLLPLAALVQRGVVGNEALEDEALLAALGVRLSAALRHVGLAGLAQGGVQPPVGLPARQTREGRWVPAGAVGRTGGAQAGGGYGADAAQPRALLVWPPSRQEWWQRQCPAAASAMLR